MSDSLEIKKEINLETKIEALLLITPSPISISQLSNILKEKPKTIEDALKNIRDEYFNNHGLRLEEFKNRYQITSAPECATIIEDYLGQEETSTLSQAALEALAIVAYRQPITRPEVDEIRGVNSDGVMRNLMNKGLVQEIGRNESPGRAILYGTTTEFLQHFGLSSTKELPEFKEVTEIESKNEKILKD